MPLQMQRAALITSQWCCCADKIFGGVQFRLFWKEGKTLMNQYIGIGTVLGDRYEIIEKIGSGGMAHVYKAHCRVLNRHVAIKVLRDEFVDDEAFARRFTTEAQAAAPLSHANIVSVFDVCSEGNLRYIVMELVEGITLKSYIDGHAPIPWETAVAIMQQICEALECAHKHGVVHQDIKPQNIILTPDGVVKVMDFGIAHATNASTIQAGNADGVFGSVHYCSPEQARGGFTDAKTDIYSAGVVLYEMLTSRVPFDAQTPVAVALKHMQEDAVPPSTIHPDMPMDLEIVVFKAMCREKHSRYASATEMLRDLNYVLDGVHVNENVDEQETVQHRCKDDVSNSKSTKKRKQKKERDAPAKKSDILIILASVFCALLLFGGVFALYLSMGGSLNEVVVPKVTDCSSHEGQAILEESKLSMIVEEIVFDTKYDAGIIVDQEPKAGKTVKKGYTVKVTVSGGLEELLVPNVVNMDVDDAISDLKAAGFKVNRKTQHSADLPKNAVVRQSPLGSTVGNKGDTVIIYVNDREMDSTVPTLTGLPLEAAKQKITEFGMTLGTIVGEKTNGTSGIVIRQTPEATLHAKPGTLINLVVSVDASGTLPDGTKLLDVDGDIGADVQQVKTVTIDVPQDKETTHIRVVQDGKDIHSAQHSESEGNFTLQVTGMGTVILDVYHDNVLVGEKYVNF